MSPFGLVITRRVKFAPADPVVVATVLPATSSTLDTDVVSAPLLLALLLPLAAATACSGLTVSMPLYSSTRTSGKLAATLKRTVTVLAPAVAAAMFGA